MAVRSHLSQVSTPTTERAHSDEWFLTCRAERAFACLQRQFSHPSHVPRQQHHRQATYQLAGRQPLAEIQPCLNSQHGSTSNAPFPVLRPQPHDATSHYLSDSALMSFNNINQMCLRLKRMHPPGLHDGRTV